VPFLLLPVTRALDKQAMVPVLKGTYRGTQLFYTARQCSNPNRVNRYLASVTRLWFLVTKLVTFIASNRLID